VPLLNLLDTEMLRPSRLIHAVCPGPDIKPGLDLLVGELQDRGHDAHRFTQRLDKVLGKEFFLEELVGAALLGCPKNPRQDVLLVVMMPEDGRAVPLPHVLPDIRRVRAAAADEPLRVVVESNLYLLVSRSNGPMMSLQSKMVSWVRTLTLYEPPSSAWRSSAVMIPITPDTPVLILVRTTSIMTHLVVTYQ